MLFWRKNHVKLSDEELAKRQVDTHNKSTTPNCLFKHSWVLSNTRTIQRQFGEKPNVIEYYVCSKCRACKKKAL
jgi:hypothetical protein